MLKAASEQLFQLADELQHLSRQLKEEEGSLQRVRSVLEEFRPTDEICGSLRLQERRLDESGLQMNRAASTLRLLTQDYIETERRIETAAAAAGTVLTQPRLSVLDQADLSDISVS